MDLEQLRHIYYSSRVLSCVSNCWEAVSNNQNNKYNSNPSEVYSLSPAIAVGPGDQPHVVYMEGKDSFQSDLANTVFDIIYSGRQQLIPPPIYFLPIIQKNSS